MIQRTRLLRKIGGLFSWFLILKNSAIFLCCSDDRVDSNVEPGVNGSGRSGFTHYDSDDDGDHEKRAITYQVRSNSISLVKTGM